MQLLMLSGNSLRNRDWIYESKERFSGLFDSFYIQDYKHWETGADWIDLSHELKVLRQQKFQEPYGVFAKSIGTVLAVQAVRQGLIKPKFLLFCGVPLNFIIANFSQFADELKACNLPTTLIHNEQDIVGSAEDLQGYLGDTLANEKRIITPGDTHDYEEYELLKTELVALRDAV